MVLAKFRVLVVDDDPSIHKFLKNLVEFWGCKEVTLASNGQEGVDSYRYSRPDLVIMDMDMPMMNGHDASRAIKSQDADAAIILLTGLPDSRIARRTLEQGFANVILPKPVHFDQLRMAVQHLLANRQPRSKPDAGKGAVA